MTLDDAYANAPYITDADAYPERWAQTADTYRGRLAAAGRARLGIMYGHGPREALDLFLPDGVPEGLCVFVHGGYWLKFDRASWSHLAEGPRAAGWAVAMPSYDLCPRARVSDITREVGSAIAAVAREVPELPIRLVGHSAGGHLVARMLAPGVLPEEVAARIERVMPISPVSDLRPLLETTINDDLKLDAEEAEAESPLLQDPPKTPVTVWVGADELPAFLDQSRWLAEAWSCDHVIEDGRHHFDVIDGLLDPDSRMVKALLA